jgi:hypothetical protein
VEFEGEAFASPFCVVREMFGREEGGGTAVWGHTRPTWEVGTHAPYLGGVRTHAPYLGGVRTHAPYLGGVGTHAPYLAVWGHTRPAMRTRVKPRVGGFFFFTFPALRLAEPSVSKHFSTSNS